MPFVSIILLLVAVLVIVAIFRAVRIVKQSTAIIVERLGRFQAAYGAGMHFLVPFIDRVRNIMDLREQVVSFPPQPVITSYVTHGLFLMQSLYHKFMDLAPRFIRETVSIILIFTILLLFL